jgi:hypothetical protein
MSRQKEPNPESKLTKLLRKAALRYPLVEEGIACKGTALECSAFKVGNKTFLFVGGKEMKIKLGESLLEAGMLAARTPKLFQVGATGWVKFSPDESPPLDLLERVIDESFRWFVPKQLVTAREERGQAKADSCKTAKEKVAKKQVRSR